MSRLIDEVLDAYGGTARWNDVNTIRAHKRFGGAIWDLKQVTGVVEDGDAVRRMRHECAEAALRRFQCTPHCELPGDADRDQDGDRVRVERRP